jgi:acetoin utilization deacetylase AcuC-like enzyme
MSEGILCAMAEKASKEEMALYLDTLKVRLPFTFFICYLTKSHTTQEESFRMTGDPNATHHLNERNDMRYTPLHCAIFAQNFDTFDLLITEGADINSKCHGSPPIHLVVAAFGLPSNEKSANSFASRALDCLLKHAELNLMAKDDQAATVFHIACEFDLVTVLDKLLECARHQNLTQDVCECRDRIKASLLHRCAARNASACVNSLLELGVDPRTQDTYGNTPLHIAGACGSTDFWARISGLFAGDGTKKEEFLSITNSFGRTPVAEASIAGYDSSGSTQLTKRQGKNVEKGATAILTHDLCRKHHTCRPSELGSEAPPENIRRLGVLLDDATGALRGKDLAASGVQWEPNARAAPLGDVLRVHEWSHVRLLQSRCEVLAEDPESSLGIGQLDGDTTISKQTYKAALHAAGSVCQAVDMVMSGQAGNAFCAVRPPGHHSGPRGLTQGPDGGPDSYGFCLLNNISIGAAYAMNVHREKIRRVVIVDFDVHHGNGTEETIRWLKPGVDMQSVTQAHSFGTLMTPRYKPWYDGDDANNVLFVSVHGYGPREQGLEYMMPRAAFYPGSGKTTLPDIDDVSYTGESMISGYVPPSSAGSTGKEGSEQFSGAASAVGVGTAVKQSEDQKQNSSSELGKKGLEGGQPGDSVGAGEGEEEDSDSEEDGDYEAGGDQDDMSIPSSAPEEPNYNSGAVSKLYNIFTSEMPQSGTKQTQPLILDVGVSLPDEDLGLGDYRHQWRNHFRDDIFPRIAAFKPDMIFISAGFDAHRKDTINSGYISLVEEDYDWATTHLARLANTHCEGRVVSALEGGYQIAGEYYSSFARSVKTHVTSLVRAARTTTPFSPMDLQKERDVERDIIAAAAAKRQAKLDRQEEMYHERMQQLAQREADIEAVSSQQPSDLDLAPAEGLIGHEAVAASTGDDAATAAAAAAMGADTAPPASKRRRASAQVDYVALAKRLQEEGAQQ